MDTEVIQAIGEGLGQGDVISTLGSATEDNGMGHNEMAAQAWSTASSTERASVSAWCESSVP